ncbi:MAG TPA: FAD/NAD(P)-binding protein [Rhizomicrobium sp.]|nr:FAD/NAD(P)-binding protein [Rhizomicrobium sp.]
MQPRTIALCGNGASAALLLVALARFCDRPVQVIVIGTGERVGAGIAYSTANPHHLLNTPSSRMSADLLAPAQFQDWLARQGISSPDFADQFVPRALYGQYLEDILGKKLPAMDGLDVRFVRDEVRDLTREDSGWRVMFGKESPLADLVVLATGNDMPSPIAPRYPDAAHRIIDNPWGPLPVAPEENVMVLGTGLTAIDVVISLLDGGHRGAIYCLSRRGLVPARHVKPSPGKALARPFPSTVRKMAHALRVAAGPAPKPADWQGAMDAMRPHWAEVWQRFPLKEKQRFLRHAMTYWSIHRHRLAPAMADRFEEAACRNVLVLKGRLARLDARGEALDAAIDFAGERHQVRVDRVINCTGPNSDPRKGNFPLAANLIAAGHAQSGIANLGLNIDDKCRVTDGRGRPQPDLFAMGALTRGRWWEITAIPEISRQATDIAGHLRAQLGVLDAEKRARAANS